MTGSCTCSKKTPKVAGPSTNVGTQSLSRPSLNDGGSLLAYEREAACIGNLSKNRRIKKKKKKKEPFQTILKKKGLEKKLTAATKYGRPEPFFSMTPERPQRNDSNMTGRPMMNPTPDAKAIKEQT